MNYDVIERLKVLQKNSGYNYDEIVALNKKLIGRTILLKRGKYQRVQATVLAPVPNSLRLVIRNTDTGRKYEVSTARIQILDVI